MSERYKNEGAGKGDKSRVSSYSKYQENMEKIYGRKSWQFWAVWEGHSLDEIEFDSSNLIEGEKISYKEYLDRLIRRK